MKKNTALKIINPILFFLLVFQLFTGLFHGLFSKETFEAIHAGNGVVLAVFALVHLALNWTWVKSTYLK